MTNAPLTFFCRTTNGNDLAPMLVVGLVFLGIYLLRRRLLQRKRIKAGRGGGMKSWNR